MLFGNVDDKTPLVVSVNDGEEDRIYQTIPTTTHHGRGASQVPKLSDPPEVVELHSHVPNPFPVIGYDLSEETHVKDGRLRHVRSARLHARR